MSHDRGWRAACGMTIWILRFHFGVGDVARGVTAMVVGSGAWLGTVASVAWKSLLGLAQGRGRKKPLCQTAHAAYPQAAFTPEELPDRKRSLCIPGKSRVAGVELSASTIPATLTLRFHWLEICLTSKMSHDCGWRAACGMAMWSLGFHFESLSVARGVTAVVVGSSAWLGSFAVCFIHLGFTCPPLLEANPCKYSEIGPRPTLALSTSTFSSSSKGNGSHWSALFLVTWLP